MSTDDAKCDPPYDQIFGSVGERHVPVRSSIPPLHEILNGLGGCDVGRSGQEPSAVREIAANTFDASGKTARGKLEFVPVISPRILRHLNPFRPIARLVQRPPASRGQTATRFSSGRRAQGKRRRTLSERPLFQGSRRRSRHGASSPKATRSTHRARSRRRKFS